MRKLPVLEEQMNMSAVQNDLLLTPEGQKVPRKVMTEAVKMFDSVMTEMEKLPADNPGYTSVGEFNYKCFAEMAGKICCHCYFIIVVIRLQMAAQKRAKHS